MGFPFLEHKKSLNNIVIKAFSTQRRSRTGTSEDIGV